MSALLNPRIRIMALASLVLLGTAWTQPAAVTDTASDQALRRLENNETGVSLSGKATSQVQTAVLGGDSTKPGQPTHENTAFTQAEVELTARPGANSRGHLLFRIHQDWTNDYAEGPGPLTARWFDVDGELYKDQIHYEIGDYLVKHSPLTLYAPEPELMYEPEIFADKRRTAMQEFFLGDNCLPLQGLNVAYNQEYLPSALGLSSDVAVARLRNVHSGPTSFFHWTDDVEKLALSSQWKLNVLEAAKVGYTQTYVYDDVAASRAGNNSLSLAQRLQVPQTLYEDNGVNSFTLDLDAARWLKNSKISFALESEYALSHYHSMRDTVDTVTSDVRTKDVGNLDGTALRSVFKAAYGMDGAADKSVDKSPFGISLSAGYLKNEKDFVSDLAQSPTFLGRRILNSRSVVGGPQVGLQPGYNTLDALYDHLYTVDPITSLNSSELWYIDAKTYNGTNNWYREPFLKNSYSFYTTTKSERDDLIATGALDPNVQLLFPFGPATPNRTGVTLNLDVTALAGALKASLVYAGLKEVEGEQIDSLTATPADYSRMGGGAKLALGKILRWAKPLSLSGSYVMESRKQSAFASKGVSVAGEKFQTAMANAGLYAGVWKGLSLLAGYQQIQSNPAIARDITPTARTSTAGNLTQDQWSVGVECRITHGAYLTAEYGRIGFNESVTKTAFAQDVTSLSMVIAY